MWHQQEIKLSPKIRGYHLITEEIVSAAPKIKDITVGLAHIFIQHTSAGLTINENADPSVRISKRILIGPFRKIYLYTNIRWKAPTT